MATYRSLGCSTCKRRKIKSDCEGIIRWELPRNRRARVRKPWIQQNGSTGAIEEGQQEETSGRSYSEVPTTTGFHSSTLSIAPAAEGSQKISMELVHAIETTKGTGFTLQLCGKHLPQLPVRIGYHKSLDSSVSCFLAAHLGMRCPGLVSKDRQHVLYRRALHDLRDALNSTRNQDVEAIIAATIVLGDFELLDGQTDNLLTHMMGGEAILKAWGATRIRSGWALDLFILIAMNMVSSSFLAGRDCFLDTPEWQAVFERAAAQPSIAATESISISFCRSYARLPFIVRTLRSPNSQSIRTEITNTILDLWSQSSAANDKVKLLMEDPQVVAAAPSRDMNSPFETYHRFHDLRVAEIFCHHWKLYILVSGLVQSYFPDRVSFDDAIERTKAALNICKCVELVRPLKPMGTYFLHHNLPRAAAELPSPYRDWAVSVYMEIVESGLEVGFDLAAPTKHLRRSLDQWQEPLYQKWLLGQGIEH
ncbi:Fungal specific transcription factor domain-containing protein [Cladophialophora immunda]|nr:Fungal specific transcription factor domain-containing protein [Cladophialophora immunda]